MRASFFKKLELESEKIIASFFSAKSPAEILKSLDFPLKPYWYFRYHKNPTYKTLFIPKRSGGEREIKIPNSGLKEVQRRLNKVLQIAITSKNCSHGFVKGKSIKTNARRHLRQHFIVNFDILNFFPTIHYGRVKGIFLAAPFNFNEQTSAFLANLCTYEGILPQGAPTSPIVSNFICRSLDNDLLSLCIENRCTYSRYGDDITISTSLKTLPLEIGSGQVEFRLSKRVEAIIVANGFEINQKKTRLSLNYQSQFVTGLKVNDRLNVGRSYIRQIRAMLHNWKKYALVKVQTDMEQKYGKKKDFVKVLQGRISYLGYVKGLEDPVYTKLLAKAKSIDSTFKVGKELKRLEKNEILVCTEGKTDWKHLKKALQRLKLQDEFINLKVRFREWTDNDKMNADELMKLCHTASMLGTNDGVLVFLFDNDHPETTKKAKGEGADFKVWNNSVYSCVLPTPDFERDKDNICIEHFYSDDDIKTEDQNGRRLFLSGEFNKKTMRHLVNPNLNCVMSPKNMILKFGIIDSNVYDGRDTNVALSKEDFAKNIMNEVGNYASVNIDQFRIIFRLIEKIEESHFQASRILL